MRNKICSEINISIHSQEKREKRKKQLNLTADPTDGLSACQLHEAICRNWGVFLVFVLQILIPAACFFCFILGCVPVSLGCQSFMTLSFMTFVIPLWFQSNLLCLYTVPCSSSTVHSKITFDSSKRIVLWLALLTSEALSILIFLCIFSQLISWHSRLELNAYFSCG